MTAPSVAAPGADSRAHRRRLLLEESLLPPLVALAIALVVGDVLILTFGQSPGAVYRLLLEGTWGNAYGFGQVLYKTTTLTFTGLAFAISARAGLFNIGAESQLAAGGFAAALAGLALPAGTPALLAVPVCILAAMLGGGLVGAVPGALQGPLRRERGDRHDHAQLRRAGAAELRHRGAPARPRDAAHARDRGRRRPAPRGSHERVPRLGREPRAAARAGDGRRGRVVPVPHARAATSCARWGCSPTPRSTAA